MIKVDGREYNVSVTEVGLDVEFMYKYAERTEDFNLQYELGAIFLNQSLTFGVESSVNNDFTDLFRLLSQKSSIDNGTGHDVEIWTPLGKMTFLMYPNKLTMNMKMIYFDKAAGEITYWSEINVKFIAVKPVEGW